MVYKLHIDNLTMQVPQDIVSLLFSNDNQNIQLDKNIVSFQALNQFDMVEHKVILELKIKVWTRLDLVYRAKFVFEQFQASSNVVHVGICLPVISLFASGLFEFVLLSIILSDCVCSSKSISYEMSQSSSVVSEDTSATSRKVFSFTKSFTNETKEFYTFLVLQVCKIFFA